MNKQPDSEIFKMALLELICLRLYCKNGTFNTSIRTLRCAHNQPLNQQKRFDQYAISKYMDYVKNYESVFEKRFPAALRVYRIFSVGIKDFYADLKRYLVVVRKVPYIGMEALTRCELELHHKMPRDIIRVTPVLIIFTLPIVNWIIYPSMYWWPRQLLCSHFWSLQQRAEFALIEQKRRLHHYKPVLRSIQMQLAKMKGHPLRPQWSHVIALLGSGLHPSVSMILECHSLFTEHPYHLSAIYSSHVKGLLKIHNMHSGWRRRKRLAERARLIHLMDVAILREGGVAALSQDDIRRACFFRGLNPTNMKSEDVANWLSDWISISQRVNEKSWSLLLHCPVLLAYNQPSNWVLIH